MTGTAAVPLYCPTDRKGRKVFLTGATGQLGGDLLIALSQHPAVGRIDCLVRPRPAESAMARLSRVFALHGDSFDMDKVRCIEGELTDRVLGDRLRASALEDTELVIHCAAETSFSTFKSRIIEATNIDGTRQMLDWAAALPGLDTFVYVGTAAICDAEQHGLVGEDDSPRASARHLVRYTESKMQAELLTAQHLPADRTLIVRPSILLGDSRGLMPRSIDVHWAVAVMNRLRLMPVDPDLPLDIIPADYAASAIVALMWSARRHRVYHISAGVRSATTARQLASISSEHQPDLPRFAYVDGDLRLEIARWIKEGSPLPPRLGPYAAYLSRWRAQFPDRRELYALFSAAAIYFEFMSLGQVYDNGRLMRDARLSAPPPAHEYLGAQLGHLSQIDLVAGIGA
jgi:nucleoside-diphosphate-sugar epimerase